MAVALKRKRGGKKEKLNSPADHQDGLGKDISLTRRDNTCTPLLDLGLYIYIYIDEKTILMIFFFLRSPYQPSCVRLYIPRFLPPPSPHKRKISEKRRWGEREGGLKPVLLLCSTLSHPKTGESEREIGLGAWQFLLLEVGV